MMQSTLDKLAKVIADQDEAVTPGLILEWAAAILEIFRSCRNPQAAKAQVRKGGPVAFGQALRLVRAKTDLRGRLARAKALDLVKAGTELTDAELDDLATESQDVPQVPRGIFQLAIAFIALVLAASTALAQSPAGIFQIDVEQNRRLDVIEKRLDEILNTTRPIAPPVAPPVADKRSAPSVLAIANNPRQAPWVETATGRTSDDHLIRVHGYTREQIAGLTQLQKDRLHGHAHEHPGAVVRPVQPAPVSAPVYRVQQQMGGCPGGVCPLPRRFRRGR